MLRYQLHQIQMCAWAFTGILFFLKDHLTQAQKHKYPKLRQNWHHLAVMEHKSNVRNAKWIHRKQSSYISNQCRQLAYPGNRLSPCGFNKGGLRTYPMATSSYLPWNSANWDHANSVTSPECTVRQISFNYLQWYSLNWDFNKPRSCMTEPAEAFQERRS